MIERSQYLNLFLQARSILSASIRLNTIGPYAAQQILLHNIRPLVEEQMRHGNLRTTSHNSSSEQPKGDDDDDLVGCVASTWPLGEILQGRHDLLHSRIFNS